MQTKKWITLGGGLMALALATAVVIANAQTKSYFVPSGGMMPNLPLNSTIAVKRNAYLKMADVRRGDIIVHTRIENGRRTDSIKRVVGLPGDAIAMSGTTISINGRALPHKLVSKIGKVSVFTETMGATNYPVQYGDNTSPTPAFKGMVPAGQVFCLGDNRDNSYDSRYSGGVFFGEIIGKRVP